MSLVFNTFTACNAYLALQQAIQAGTFAAFEAVPAGGVIKLANPLAAQVFDLEGKDSHDYAIAPAPSVTSAETAAEMVELYYKTLSRDIPFAEFVTRTEIGQAASELAKLTDFKGRKTQATLFRGNWKGDVTGPFISQFLYKNIPFGAMTISQMYQPYTANVDFMTDASEWLAIQNGQAPHPAIPLARASTARYIITGRDLATYVHTDFSYQAYQSAALMLLGMGTSYWDDGNPYKTAARQGAFADLGATEVLDMVARSANAGLRAAWFQKWNVHRRLRPEAYAGLVANNPSLLHPQVVNSTALQMIKAKFANSVLLPMAYPEGSPTHPAYPAGHAAVAGACVTVLKAFFKEDMLIANPLMPAADGLSLQAYNGQLTVGDELDKLASNISLGRDWAGVHYRSDSVQGMLLGEQVGIAILRDWKAAHPLSPTLTLKKFNGSVINI
jgi:membrane-associated phospholipid phosphatase